LHFHARQAAVAGEAGGRRLDGRPELPAALKEFGDGALTPKAAPAVELVLRPRIPTRCSTAGDLRPAFLRFVQAMPELALGGVLARLVQRAVGGRKRLPAALRLVFGLLARIGDPALDFLDFGVAVARHLGL